MNESKLRASIKYSLDHLVIDVSTWSAQERRWLRFELHQLDVPLTVNKTEHRGLAFEYSDQLDLFLHLNLSEDML